MGKSSGKTHSMKISVVVPVFNEEKNLEELFERLEKVLSENYGDYELIFINDGSTDSSGEILSKIKAGNSKVTVIEFSRNYGQTAALDAGFKKACGEIIVTLDSDLQNPPEEIPGLVKTALETGADVVSGWRFRRKDSLPRRIVSGTANRIISVLCGVKLHDFGCTLKAYRREAVKGLNLYGEMHRFIPAFIHWNGGRIAEKKVLHNPRSAGRSSYGMGRIPRVILDLITTKFLTTYSSRPIHVFGSFGLFSIIAGFFASAYVVVRKIYMGGEWISPLFFISVFLLGLGLILILMGILAEIAVRIYFSQTGNPPYRIKRKA